MAKSRAFRSLAAAALLLGACAPLATSARGPATTGVSALPAPDYASPAAWLAFPGRNGLERSAPPGAAPVDEKAAPVDVFFIHPTTIQSNDTPNAPYDASDSLAPLNPPVLLQQASVFNGCCRIYAPHYRQATLAGLKDAQAVQLAYGDVQRAFRYYLEHENHGRPFILASHSQGTMHAVRLVQEEILGKPLQARMVAAYLIGSLVPDRFPAIGLPICDDARQTSCLVAWNTQKAGAKLPGMIFRSNPYWWQGQPVADKPVLACVNPLTWRREGAAPAAANPGSLPFPVAPFAAAAEPLPPLVPRLTGAACDQGMLEVEIAPDAPGFADKLSRAVGSYHLNDYGIFYAALRQNAIDRAAAWLAAHPGR